MLLNILIKYNIYKNIAGVYNYIRKIITYFMREK